MIRKFFLFIFFFLGYTALMAQKNKLHKFYGCYQCIALDSNIATHRTVAILPAEVVLLDIHGDPDVWVEKQKLARDASLYIQYKLYNELFQFPDPLSTQFQPPDTTRLLLQKNHINPDSLRLYSRKDISDILGVDAVITPKYYRLTELTEKQYLFLNGISIVASILSAASGSYAVTVPAYFPMSKTHFAIFIHDGHTGELLWMDKGLETKNPKLNPVKPKKMTDLPYKHYTHLTTSLRNQ